MAHKRPGRKAREERKKRANKRAKRLGKVIVYHRPKKPDYGPGRIVAEVI